MGIWIARATVLALLLVASVACFMSEPPAPFAGLVLLVLSVAAAASLYYSKRLAQVHAATERLRTRSEEFHAKVVNHNLEFESLAPALLNGGIASEEATRVLESIDAGKRLGHLRVGARNEEQRFVYLRLLASSRERMIEMLGAAGATKAGRQVIGDRDVDEFVRREDELETEQLAIYDEFLRSLEGFSAPVGARRFVARSIARTAALRESTAQFHQHTHDCDEVAAAQSLRDRWQLALW